MHSHERIVDRPVPTETDVLPRTTPVWGAIVLISVVMLLLGVVAFLQQEEYGDIVTGMRTPGYGGASWGLYIIAYVFYVGVSFAGITVAAMSRLFDIAILKPVTRIAELLTITALLAGAAAVLADLGRIEVGLVNLPGFANPSSPFYGTFTLVVAAYLFSSLVYFFLAGRADAAYLANHTGPPLNFLYRIWASGYRDLPAQRARHHKVSYWLALTILPLLVIAHSTLGFIFGLMSGRPGWYSALQAPGFVLLAGVSGTGMLIVFATVLRKVFGLHGLKDASIRWLGNFLWILAAIYLYFTIVEELTATYAGPRADQHVAHEVVAGDFAALFWTYVGALLLTFLLPFLLYLRNRTSTPWLVVAGIAANVAAVCKRYIIVVPSQTHGALMPVEPPRVYVPTVIELAVSIGLFGAIVAAMFVFGRFFILVPRPHDHGAPPRHRELGRAFAAFGTGFVGISLVVAGLTDSFRLWSGTEVDPRIKFSPVIFASGVMLLFIAAAVYEIFPEKRRPARELWADQKRAQQQGPLPWDAAPVAARQLEPPDRSALRQLVRLAGTAQAYGNEPLRVREILDEIDVVTNQIRRSANIS